MLKLKINKIKNLKHAKSVFNFISNSRKKDAVYHDDIPVPLYDIHKLLLNNLENQNYLQFYTKLYDTIIGSVVLHPLPQDPNQLFLQVFAIHKQFRKQGYASIMLSRTIDLATKHNFKSLVVDYNSLSYHFFKNNLFELYLEVVIPINISDKVSLDLIEQKIQVVQTKATPDYLIVKFKADSPHRSTLMFFNKISTSIKTKYILERAM